MRCPTVRPGASTLVLLRTAATACSRLCSGGGGGGLPATASAAPAVAYAHSHRLVSSLTLPAAIGCTASSLLVSGGATSAAASRQLPPVASRASSMLMAHRPGIGGGSSSSSSDARSAANAAAAAAAGAAALSAAATATTASASSCEGESSSSSSTEIGEAETNAPMPFPESSIQIDTYNGVTLDVTQLPAALASSPDSFRSALSTALRIWTAEGKRGIWIRLPTSHSHLIPPATSPELGFDFQFAERGHVVLTRWLPQSESRLPPGPTHQVGVGALVLHPRTGRMLVVQERTGPAAARKLWKMPTGLTDPGEDIADAAVRELAEETGLRCVFDRIVCFRQAHGGLFNRSDLFFVCLCRLDASYEEGLGKGDGGGDDGEDGAAVHDIELVPQEEEIAAIQWMDVDDYMGQEVWQASPLYSEMHDAMVHAAGVGIGYGSGREGGGRVNGGGADLGGEGGSTGAETAAATAVATGRARSCNGDSLEQQGSSASAASARAGFVGKKLPVGFRPGHNTVYLSDRSSTRSTHPHHTNNSAGGEIPSGSSKL